MIRHLFRRCSHTPEDQAAVGAFRAHQAATAALRSPQPWTPGACRDVAVRVGPFVERAHPRPGDDCDPEVIAVSLGHPDTGTAAAYLHGHQLGYIGRGWLRCETTAILGTWQPAYAPLTHAAADLALPGEVGMEQAHYAVTVEACKTDGNGHTLLRLGPYMQTQHASRDAARLITALSGRETTLVPGAWISAWTTEFDVNAHKRYIDPYMGDVPDLLDDAIAGTRA
ncbi:hypothetical protein [Streptomyces sp. NPDC051561]|uniref:hypothetical protein n=1 Tax=Streptomyces sp. NPDC051561 TaxID=3365658 RepID=UPI00378CA561